MLDFDRLNLKKLKKSEKIGGNGIALPALLLWKTCALGLMNKFIISKDPVFIKFWVELLRAPQISKAALFPLAIGMSLEAISPKDTLEVQSPFTKSLTV